MKSLQIFAITTIFLSGFFTTNAYSKPKQIYKPYHNSVEEVAYSIQKDLKVVGILN